jgi:DEAD/DEAH box helicase domain-containing protein
VALPPPTPDPRPPTPAPKAPIVGLAETLDGLRHAPEHRDNFVVWGEFPPREARYAPVPDGIDPRLVDALKERGIERLWTHQAEAASAALRGENVTVVTPTASGKTLCYNLPVLSTILADPSARAIYLFPTKALAQDQMDELHGLITATGQDIKTYTYDGDTPGDIRRAVRSAGHVVITNPDMLHTGVLPHHTKWQKLFENLRYVVIDELHGYRGVFGSHVANVVRRLRRICHFYGSNPVFICCSATIANPKELAEKLLDTPVTLIDDNGAPAGKKIVALYNPPVVNKELGIRRSSMAVARALAGRLITSGVQTIVFASSRTSVELLLTYLKRELRQRPGVSERVRGYRGGYLPNERRQIEKGLRDGDVRGVVATNALELGIDIGSLEAAVLLGYPGSVSSTWQQFGRAGRRHELAAAIMVATSSPLNQYIATHPDFIFQGAPESGLINPDNFYVLVSHLKCASFELPFTAGEPFGANTDLLLDLLVEEGVLHREGDRYHWMSEVYPAENVSLRSASVDNFVIIDTGAAYQVGSRPLPPRPPLPGEVVPDWESGTPPAGQLSEVPRSASARAVRPSLGGAGGEVRPRVIGEVDRPSAPMLVHKDAIYFHGGRQYHVDRLDYEERKAYVHAVDVDYYTDAELAVDLGVLTVDREEETPSANWAHGDVKVAFQPTVFKKIKLDTHENVGWERIDLPQEDLHTVATWLAVQGSTTEGLTKEDVQGGIWGLGNLLVTIAPVFVLCDPRDLHVWTQVKAPFTDLPTVFLYDAAPGGVGLTEKLFELRGALLRAARDHVRACPCDAGCPSCVGPQNEVAGDPKRAALTMLERLTATTGRNKEQGAESRSGAHTGT